MGMKGAESLKEKAAENRKPSQIIGGYQTQEESNHVQELQNLVEIKRGASNRFILNGICSRVC